MLGAIPLDVLYILKWKVVTRSRWLFFKIYVYEYSSKMDFNVHCLLALYLLLSSLTLVCSGQGQDYCK